MANLYDTPAQAQFINTYVPIQFDSLYRMADKASADTERANILMDKLSEYRSLGSLSSAANKEWEERVWNPIQSYIDANINDVHDLSRPDVVSGLRNLQRRISSSPETRILLESKEAYKQAASKVDPKWGNYYSSKISSHNPLVDGIWTENPLEYSDWNTIGDKLTKDIGPRKLGSTNGGLTEIWGVAKEDIMSAINDNASAIISDPGNVETAKAQLSRLGIPQGRPVIVNENGKDVEIPYEQYLGRYILESVSSSAMDKANQRTEKTNEVAMHRERMANEWARTKFIEAKKDERAASKAKGVVGSITKEWQDRAIASMAEKRLSAINSKIEIARGEIQKSMGGKATDEQINKQIREMFGDDIFGYWESNRRARWIGNRLKLEQDRKATAAVNGDADTVKEANSNISSLSESYNNELMRSNQLSMVAINRFNREASLAREGKSRLFSRQELVAMDQYDIPADLSATWSEMNIGAPVELFSAGNVKYNTYQIGNTGAFRYSSPLYGNQASSSSIKSNIGLQKFNDGLINSRGSGQMFFESSNKAFLESDGSSMAGYATVPEEVLRESFGMTESDIKQLKKSPGVSSFRGRPIKINPSDLYNSNNEPIEDKRALDVMMVRIPVATKFVGKEDSALQQQMVDLEYEKKWRKNNLGIGDLTPMEDF